MARCQQQSAVPLPVGSGEAQTHQPGGDEGGGEGERLNTRGGQGMGSEHATADHVEGAKQQAQKKCAYLRGPEGVHDLKRASSQQCQPEQESAWPGDDDIGEDKHAGQNQHAAKPDCTSSSSG